MAEMKMEALESFLKVVEAIDIFEHAVVRNTLMDEQKVKQAYHDARYNLLKAIGEAASDIHQTRVDNMVKR